MYKSAENLRYFCKLIIHTCSALYPSRGEGDSIIALLAYNKTYVFLCASQHTLKHVNIFLRIYVCSQISKDLYFSTFVKKKQIWQGFFPSKSLE